MSALADLGWASLERIATVIGVDARTLRRDHEPYLLRLGLIEVTPRGRRAVC